MGLKHPDRVCSYFLVKALIEKRQRRRWLKKAIPRRLKHNVWRRNRRNLLGLKANRVLRHLLEGLFYGKRGGLANFCGAKVIFFHRSRRIIVVNVKVSMDLCRY